MNVRFNTNVEVGCTEPELKLVTRLVWLVVGGLSLAAVAAVSSVKKAAVKRK
jgi:hypothetical protein